MDIVKYSKLPSFDHIDIDYKITGLFYNKLQIKIYVYLKIVYEKAYKEFLWKNLLNTHFILLNTLTIVNKHFY